MRDQSPTISAKPVGVGVASQPLILGDERSELPTRIAATESVLLRTRRNDESWNNPGREEVV
jgi:hypothetical protein